MALAIRKRTVTLVVVMVLALLSWWIQQQQQVIKALDKKGAPLMDYSLTDFEIIAMDDQGAPRQRLQAASMMHFAEPDYAELAAPQLEVYRQDTSATRLQADKALVYQGGDSVFLQGEVRIRREATSSQGAMELQTSDVWYDAVNELAKTDAQVTINNAIGTTTARGMEADIKTGNVVLLSSVRGKYVQK